MKVDQKVLEHCRQKSIPILFFSEWRDIRMMFAFAIGRRSILVADWMSDDSWTMRTNFIFQLSVNRRIMLRDLLEWPDHCSSLEAVILTAADSSMIQTLTELHQTPSGYPT